MENKEADRPAIFIKRERDIKKWHVLYVKSRHEKTVNEELKEDGYMTYLPLLKTLRRWSQRKKWVEEPVFKSYLFVKVRRNELYDLMKYKDVLTYVRFAGEPATVREETLLFIKKLLINKTTFDVEEGDLKVGKKIKLKSGPFKGMEGNIIELRGKSKLVVEIKSLSVKLVIPMDEIMPEG